MTTPLQTLQAELGVEFFEWDGWPWPANFGDAEGEYLAVRRQVGLVDSSGLRKWEFRGPDAIRAVDHITTQDCAAMVDGRVHYTPMCSTDGSILDDITVFRLAVDRVMVVSGIASTEKHLREATGHLDLEIVHLSNELASLQLQGPRSRDALSPQCTIDLSKLPYFHCEEGTVAGERCVVSRTGYSGELGYEIFASPESAARIWTCLMEANASLGIRPYGLEAADYLRVESGLIFVTFDYMPGESTPFELNLGWAVALDKPDFIGKDALSRLAGEGPVRRIVGLEFEEATVPEPGTAVFRDGEEVGTLTVACASALLGRVLALAMLDGDIAKDTGTRVEVGGSAVRVANLPFYDPERTRPRS